MDYYSTLQYLYTSTPVFQREGASAYKPGLHTTELLDKYFSHPHTQYPTIHIAGTNGKGSCSHTLAAILQSAGYRVGLFTSPHLIDFRERIRINGEMISEEYVINFVEQHRSFFEPLHPSFFELTTLMAFTYFAQQHVDIAIIEVGLGGRLDSTNIIHPLLSIITNISIEHTQFLGSTLKQIAKEKGGIIKHHTSIIIGETDKETRPVFTAIASQQHSDIIFAEDNPEIITTQHTEKQHLQTYHTVSYGNLIGQLTGECQEKNTNTILTAIHYIQSHQLLNINNGDIQKGLRHVVDMTGLRGRWEILHSSPLTICDTGHNAGGWKYLSQRLNILSEKKQLYIVFGMAADKDIKKVISLLPQQAEYFWTQASVKRALPAEKLYHIAQQHGLKGKTYADVTTAYHEAQRKATADDAIFIGGSNFILADLFNEI